MSPLIITLDFTPSPTQTKKKRQLRNKKKKEKKSYPIWEIGSPKNQNHTPLINLHYPKLASWV